MRSVLAGLVAVGIGLTLVVSAPPVIAGQCSSKTGGSNDKVMWTGSKFTCAYVVDNGDNKITPGNVETFESKTAKGYTRRTSCQKQSGGVEISPLYVESSTGSTMSWTAWNKQDGNRHWSSAVLWHTSSAGQVAGNQFINNCDHDTIRSNLYHVSASSILSGGPLDFYTNQKATYSVRVTAPANVEPAVAGGVVLYRMRSTSQASAKPPVTACDGTTNSVDKDIAVSRPAPVQSDGYAYPSIEANTLQAGEYKIYAAYSGTPMGKAGTASGDVSVPGHCLAPPAKLLTPSTSNLVTIRLYAVTSSRAVESTPPRTVTFDTGTSKVPAARRDAVPSGKSYPVRIINRKAVTPNVPTAVCPKNSAVLNVGVLSPTATVRPLDIKWTKRGAKVRSGKIPDGATLRMQLLCRPKSAGVATWGSSTYGSIHGDRLTSSARKSLLYGGRGHDRIWAVNKSSVASGGIGSDQIIISGDSAAANGGPGRDRLVARSTTKVLLVGGLGRDVLIGAKGDTMMNAADGRPGDRVVCKSSKNRVIVDDGDKIVGPCTVISPAD